MILRPSGRGVPAAGRFASLPDFFVAICTLVLAPIVEIGLRTVGLRRTTAMLRIRLVLDGLPRAAAPGPTAMPLLPHERRRLIVAWRILELGPFNSTCLRRAIIAARLLRGRNHAVRIGIRTTTQGFKAHAWLEINGVSLDPDAPGQFSSQWQQANES